MRSHKFERSQLDLRPGLWLRGVVKEIKGSSTFSNAFVSAQAYSVYTSSPSPMIHLQMLMQFITEHPIAILVSVLAYYILGMVWYGMLFSKIWMKLNGMTPEFVAKLSKADMRNGMIHGTVMSLITGFVMTAVLGRGMEILDMSSPTYPLIIATILWLPFTGLPFAQSYAYLRKPFVLLCIDAGYMLAGMWTISLVLYASMF